MTEDEAEQTLGEYQEARISMQAGLDLRDKVFEAFLETPERRSRLARACMASAQLRLDFTITKRRYWPEGGHSVASFIKEFQRIIDRLDGTEKFDHVRFRSMFSDLRALQAEINQVRSLAGETKQQGHR